MSVYSIHLDTKAPNLYSTSPGLQSLLKRDLLSKEKVEIYMSRYRKQVITCAR
jgi:hypothetical protein